MSPKGCCVKDLVPSVVLLRGGGTFKRQGLVRGLQVIGGALEEHSRIQAPSSSSFWWHAVSSLLYHALWSECAILLPPQSNAANLSWVDTFKTVSQNKLFLGLEL